ncbi:hypothetical protein ACFXGG_33525 [Streptomyces nigra]|uniref:hypothetical protein n=1 Tax=Streptomyces nigra TaxID=1827580 RepID=UPI0036C60B57
MSDSTQPPNTQCGQWLGAEARYCRETRSVRHYLSDYRCPEHTPAALQGKPEVPTGPGWPIYREAQA